MTYTLDTSVILHLFKNSRLGVKIQKAFEKDSGIQTNYQGKHGDID
jgi:hypothetical protein